MDGPYLPRSHHWGNIAMYELAKAELEVFRTGFAADNVPETFAEAIKVTGCLRSDTSGSIRFAPCKTQFRTGIKSL